MLHFAQPNPKSPPTAAIPAQSLCPSHTPFWLRFANRQRAQADQVDSGERLLACWPTDCLDFQIYLHDDDYAREKADAARLATYDSTAQFDASDHDCADENYDDDNDDADDDDD